MTLEEILLIYNTCYTLNFQPIINEVWFLVDHLNFRGLVVAVLVFLCGILEDNLI